MAQDIQHQIKSTIQAFAADLEALVRSAAVAAVADALGTGAPAKRGPGRPKGKRSKGASAKKASSASPVLISSSLLKVLAHIRNHPGQRSEQIRDALNITKPSWVKASTQLLAEGKIGKQGTRRSTTYTAK